VFAQATRQVAVEFDDGELPQAFDQGLRQRGQAGTDLDHGLAGCGCDLAHDGVDDGAVGQKVLTKALAGDVLHAQRWAAGALIGPTGVTSGGSRIST